MAITYNTRIVRDGLVMHLDAANTKSYPGTGTTWTDLSGRGNNFTLGSAVVFNSQGWITYAVNNASSFAQSNSALSLATTSITVDCWVRTTGHGDWNDFVSNNWVNNGWLLFASSTAWAFGIGNAGAQFVHTVAHNNSTNWTHLAGTYNGSTVRCYVNGVLGANPTAAPTVTLDTGFVIRVGQQNDPNSYNISSVKVYNRALSAIEVRQNFEAHRDRYGI